PERLQGRAAKALPEADRPAGQELEVLACGRARALFVGRLPACVLGDAQSHQHRVGAVVRDPGRPQVVCAHRGRRGDREDARGDRPPLPRAPCRHPARAGAGEGRARGGGAGRRQPRSLESAAMEASIELQSAQDAVDTLWWLPIVTGSLWILFSLLLFRFDYASVTAISILFGVVCIAGAVS